MTNWFVTRHPGAVEWARRRGIVVAVPIVWTLWDVVFGSRRRRRRWFREAGTARGEAPAILIVDLLPGKDVRASVERFRGQ